MRCHIATKQQVHAGQRQVLITHEIVVRGSRLVRAKVSSNDQQHTSNHHNGKEAWWRMVPASSAVATAAAILVSCSPFLPSQAQAASPAAGFGLTTEQNVGLLPPIPTTFDPLPELTLPSFSRVGIYGSLHFCMFMMSPCSVARRASLDQDTTKPVTSISLT